jgi:hypothetical protein
LFIDGVSRPVSTPHAPMHPFNRDAASHAAQLLGRSSDPVATLRRLLRCCGFTEKDLAAALGVPDTILAGWLHRGARVSAGMRHHIWLVSSLLDGTAPRNLFELSTWNRFRDWEADEREAREQEQRDKGPEPAA